MKKFQLVFITENQNKKEKATKLAELISEIVSCKNVFEVSEYKKLENSFKIEMVGAIEDSDNSIEAAIKLTDKICSPWLVTYDDEVDEIELFFNKTKHAKFKMNEFNVLVWGNFEILQES